MILTLTQAKMPPLTSSDVRRERLARRLDAAFFKCRNSDTSEKDTQKKTDEIRKVAQSRYQSAIDEFITHAKANAIAKKKKTKSELVALFLLLMLDAGEDVYLTGYPKLEKLNPPIDERNETTPEIIKDEAEEFSKARQKLLSNFPATTLHRLDEVIAKAKTEASEKEIRSLLNKAGEIIRNGTGKTVAETEAQAFYGDAQRRVLQRAGFKTKIWQTCEDEKVRKSHVDCGEQGAIPIGKPFINGLQYPGDPNGGPEEVCNCRCWLIGGSR